MCSRSVRASQGIFIGFLAVGAFVLGLFVSVPVHAQVVGATLSGTVSDPSGALIPGATVSIKNTATGVTRDVVTDSAGFYSAPNLLPGTYDVTVSAKGFSTAINSNVSLAVGAQQVLNQTMQVGQTTQQVQVTGAAPTVQLASSTLSNQVNSRTVRELPLNGRDWTQLATLEPGITAIRAQTAVGGTAGRGNR